MFKDFLKKTIYFDFGALATVDKLNNEITQNINDDYLVQSDQCVDDTEGTYIDKSETEEIFFVGCGGFLGTFILLPFQNNLS